jgi:hypothetical protein
MKAKLFYVVYLLLLLLLIEFGFRVFVFKEGSVYQSTYEAVSMEESTPGYVSQPYLNYINNPRLKDMEGYKEINSMGIR